MRSKEEIEEGLFQYETDDELPESVLLKEYTRTTLEVLLDIREILIEKK